ncbi:MAG: hypothetical protein HYR96_02000 [Deltaproteobacteria bacterium]|nr:hypothetical protein [Deltaproteobacteria bacterium]MBI3295642.1 hypothetical protein [Deltaproteobacteria bacterium]
MKIALLVIVGLVLISCDQMSPGNLTNFAGNLGDMTGTWTVTNPTDTLGGSVNQCATTKFTIYETAASLSISSRTFSCAHSSYQTVWQEASFQMSGETLHYNGSVVGTKAPQSFKFSIPVGTGAIWTFSLYSNGTAFKYTETTTGRSTTAGAVSRY